MNKISIAAAHTASQAEVAAARLGQRFGRMDLSSQLCLLAVEPFAPLFDNFSRDRIAVVIATRAGSLPTDVTYWAGRDAAGGLSPTLFTYTLPSATIGELAIRHRLTGPNLCSVGDSANVLAEGRDFLRSGEADAVICVSVEVISAALAKIIALPETAQARALFLQNNAPGLVELPENDRDMAMVFATLCAQNLTK